MLTSLHWYGSVGPWWLLGLRLDQTDVWCNVLLYVPLGLLLRLYWRSLGRGRAAQFIWPLAAGFALSWGLESLQQLLPMRVASLADVVSNTLGAAVGALGAVLFVVAMRRAIVLGYRAIGRVKAQLTRHRAAPAVAFAIMFRHAVRKSILPATAILLAIWWGYGLLADPANAAGVHGGWSLHINELPFWIEFLHSYNVAAMLVVKPLLIWCAVAAMATLAMRSWRRSPGAWALAGLLVTLALARQALRLAAGETGDVTDLVLAAMAVMLVWAATWALRRSQLATDKHG